MNHVLIGLGSNIGDRLSYLKGAISLLDSHKEIKVIATSSIYETEPVGYVEQASFLNIVIQIYTSLNPYELLKVTQKIELELGRERKIHWGPRTIDLDILLFNHENIKAENLIIPHPRIGERAFVLIPLDELAETDKTVLEMVATIPRENVDKSGVVVWKQKDKEKSSLF